MKKEGLIIWFDWQYCAVSGKDLEKLTPGILNAKGIFETMKADRGTIAFLPLHFKRFRVGLKFYGIKSSMTPQKFKIIIGKLIKLNCFSPARARLMAWTSKETHTAVVCQKLVGFSEVKMRRGLCAKTKRVNSSWPNSRNLKTLNYRIFRQAFTEASSRGFDEAILLNRKQQIVEGARTNIFFVKDKMILTPALSSGCLRGIARQAVIKILKKMGLALRESSFKMKDVAAAQEAFLTNAVIGVVPLVSINRKLVGSGKPGPLTLKLAKFYSQKAKRIN